MFAEGAVVAIAGYALVQGRKLVGVEAAPVRMQMAA